MGQGLSMLRLVLPEQVPGEPGVRREGGTDGRRSLGSAGPWRALGRSSELAEPGTRLDFTEWLCLLSFSLATLQDP